MRSALREDSIPSHDYLSIAVAIFQRGVGECAYRSIRVANADDESALL